MGAPAQCTILAIAVVLRKAEQKNPISAPKEIQSRKAVLHAVEREIGLA
jgi:hypothetical protein